jgi:hypothetical protein
MFRQLAPWTLRQPCKRVNRIRRGPLFAEAHKSTEIQLKKLITLIAAGVFAFGTSVAFAQTPPVKGEAKADVKADAKVGAKAGKKAVKAKAKSGAKAEGGAKVKAETKK